MSLNSERDEIDEVVNRLLDGIAATVSSSVGSEGVTLRQKIGDLRANYFDYLQTGLFTTKLLACFTAARLSNVKLPGLTNLHWQLFEETPVGDISKNIVQVAIVFCLTTESRLITAIEFSSRDDVEIMLRKSKVVFDTARDLTADMPDSSGYQQLTALAGALTNHLSTIARPLPSMVTFELTTSLPALVASQRVYLTADRWEELYQENKIVHPAFMLRELRGMST